MSSETKYWCDRCGIELKTLDLVWINIERDTAESSRPQRKHLELCVACSNDVQSAIDATMAKAGTD